MHHLAVKSNLVNADSMPMSLKLGFAGEDQPVCPKPRRWGVPPEFLKPPPHCHKHSLCNAEEKSEVLTMIATKAQSDDGREWVGSTGCCSSTCYCWGSPPTRTDNALVHDLQFLHQMELLSPFMRMKLTDRLGFASASPI